MHLFARYTTLAIAAITSLASSSAMADDLDGEWTVFTVNGRKITGEERPTLIIDGTRLYATIGANVVNASISSDDSSALSFYDLRSTHVPTTDVFEPHIVAALEATRAYTLTPYGHEDYLNLLNERGNMLMVMRRHNMSFLNGAWTIATINGAPVGNQAVAITIDIPERHIHGNTGGNILNGSIYIDPDKPNSLQFLNLAITNGRCADKTTQTDLLIALESAESAIATADGTIVITDNAGNNVLTLTPRK